MLVIPNKEVREVFVLQIQEWFKAVVANDNDTMRLLSKAILDKDEAILARQLNIVMGRMIAASMSWNAACAAASSRWRTFILFFICFYHNHSSYTHFQAIFYIHFLNTH